MKRNHRSFYRGPGQIGKNLSFIEAITHAVHGLVLGFIFEVNIRRQFLIFLVAVVLGWLLAITPVQWAALSIAAAFVFILELINSSIEALADAVHPDYSEHIQRSKDLAAGAVLGASLVALVIGLTIFLPLLLDLVR